MTESRPTYTVTVTANKISESNRLDRVLSTELPELSRTRIQDLITSGKVERDGWGTLIDANERVKVGDVLRVDVPPSRPSSPPPEAIPLTIVYEDSSLVVIDKPPDMVVHPGAGNWGGTIVNAAAARYAGCLPAIKGRDRPGIVHRLDKDTSGLMVLAKTEHAFHHLSEQFARHRIERKYLALTWGHPRPVCGRITSRIGRHRIDRQRMANVAEDGKQAITRFETVGFIGDNAAVVACWPETGRTHQIRVHLASIGYPIIGDPVYGGAEVQRTVPFEVKETVDFFGARQALHAQVIGFIHPKTKRKTRLKSEFPFDIRKLQALLEKI